MARNSSGTHSLPAGNPVVSGATIDSSDFNDTMSDFSTEITDSLSRSGKGGMSAALELDPGTVGAPGLSFVGDTDTGLYRIGADDLGISIGGVIHGEFDGDGLAVAVGAVGTPGLSFLTDRDTGLYRVGANDIGVAAGGARVGGFDAAGILIPGGSVAAPGGSIIGDRDTGIASASSNRISLIGGGVELARGITAATGGLQANNQLTGVGLERVLTTSDFQRNLVAGIDDDTFASDSTLGNLNLTTVDGTVTSLTFPVGTYIVKTFFRVNCGSSTPDFKWSFAKSGAWAGTINLWVKHVRGTADTIADVERISSNLSSTFDNVVAIDSASYPEVGVEVWGKMSVTTEGALTFQAAQNTSNAATVSLTIGSLEFVRIE